MEKVTLSLHELNDDGSECTLSFTESRENALELCLEHLLAAHGPGRVMYLLASVACELASREGPVAKDMPWKKPEEEFLDACQKCRDWWNEYDKKPVGS